MSTDREEFESLVKDSPTHNNQMLRRHALDAEKYQYDSIQFAYECFLAAKKSGSGWISVDDRLPTEKFNDFLVYPAPDGYTMSDQLTAEYTTDGKWLVHTEDSYAAESHDYHPTHWQPLPRPPKDANNE